LCTHKLVLWLWSGAEVLDLGGVPAV
jgi:hypothetical protein